MNENSKISIFKDELFLIRNYAQKLVHISKEVVLLINDLRSFVQTKLKSEVYISDRRLLNVVKILKIIAYTNGRKEISPFDCVLLQHCLWFNPEQQESILEFLMDKFSADKEILNFEVIIQRIFVRSCLVLTGAAKDDSLHHDMKILQNELISRLEQLISSIFIGLPIIENNIWISSEEVFSLSSILLRKSLNCKNILQGILIESEILKEILEKNEEPSLCAELLGARWADFLKIPLKLKTKEI